MKRWFWLFAVFWAVVSIAEAPPAGPARRVASLTVEEEDGDPSVSGVRKIQVTNGNLTDDGGKVVSIASGSGDIESVGDAISGAALDGTSDGGTYIRLYDGDSNYTEVNNGDANQSADLKWVLPDTNGTAGQVLEIASVASDTITLEWDDDTTGAGSGAFSDASDPIVQNTTGKDVHMGDGAGTLTGKVEIGGDADQPQFIVEGFSTQTDSLIIAQNDADTQVFNVDNDGTVLSAVGFDVIGNVDMDYGSADVDDHTFTTDGTGTAEFVIPAGSIDSTEILDNTIANADMADNSIDSDDYVDGSIDLAHMSSASVDSDNIVDATIDQVDIDDTDTLAGDPAHGNSSVWFATTGLIFEGATSNTNEGLLISSDVGADRTWTLPDVTGTLVSTGDTATVDATMMAANSVDSSELVDGSVDASHLAADIIDETKIADNGIDSEHYNDGSIDLAHMSSASVDSDNIVDGEVDFADIKYDNTLAGDPALAVDEIYFFADASGPGFISEGSTADTNEQLYRFPDANGADTTEYIVVADDANVSAAEAGYLDGVTSAIQTQIDAQEAELDNSAGLAAALSDETGTGVAVFGTAPTFTTEVTLTPVATPTTDADGEIAIDIDAWGTGYDAIEFYNSTHSAYVVATQASDTPTNGQVAKWNTGGTITWEDDATGGTTAYDTIGDPTGVGLITFGDTETATYDSAEDGGTFMTLSLSDTDLAADTTALLITAVDNDDANYIPLHIQDDQDGTPDTLFKVGSDGQLTVGATTTVKPTAKYEITINAASLAGTTTAGAGDANGLPESREGAGAAGLNYDYIAFDTSSDETAYWSMTLPGWDEGAITFRYKWTNTGGATTQGVSFWLRALAIDNDDTLNPADIWGTAIEVTDDWIAQNDLHISPESASVTVGGSPTDDELIHFELYRDVSDADDDMAGDADILEIIITYTRDSYSDA